VDLDTAIIAAAAAAAAVGWWQRSRHRHSAAVTQEYTDVVVVVKTAIGGEGRVSVNAYVGTRMLHAEMDMQDFVKMKCTR
jgi:hypothetical protein